MNNSTYVFRHIHFNLQKKENYEKGLNYNKERIR